jgi:hypothetical protein
MLRILRQKTGSTWGIKKTPWPETERPPLFDEVSANFCGYRVSWGITKLI